MKQYKHCVFLLADGARPDVIGHLLKQGELPNFHKLFIEQGTFKRAVTVFPSTTGPAYLPFLTGYYPGHCNIPGIRWFDRSEYAKEKIFNFRRFRSYVGVESYFFNRDLAEKAKTLFHFSKKPVNIFNIISQGSGFRGDHTRFTRSFYVLYAYSTQQWKFVDRWIGREIRRGLRKKPDFLFAVFPSVDELSHRTHPFSAPVLDAYRQVDLELGEIYLKCKHLGMLEETLFLFTSDHGMSATHSHFDLVQFMEQQGYQTFYYPLIFKRNFNLAVMQSGNSMAHLYLRSSFSGWSGKRERNELEELMEPLCKRPEIAWVASLTEEGAVYVRGKQGEAWIEEKDQKIYFKTKGEDPFGFKNIKSSMTDEESLEVSFDQKYPDAFRQLLQIFKSERTGDLVVTAAPGYDLRFAYEWPEHTASHGSLVDEHMHIPFASSHPIGSTKKIRSVDVFPSILKWMGNSELGNVDGKCLF